MVGDYIKRKAAIGFVKNRTPNMDGWTTLNAVEVSLQNVPAADVVEVRHGEWVKPTPCSQEYCSQCGLTPKMVFGMLPNYCPHCGAKMDGKDGGE